MSIIEAKRLTKVYRRGSEDVHALRGIDFSVEPGEFVAIVGPSGSGKTALLNILGCLDTPTSGSVRLDGTDLGGVKERDLVKIRRERIGFIFQQFFLIPTLTVRENIEVPLLFSGKEKSEEKIDRILDQVGLADRSDHLPHQISGGQMQRVAIGRALVNDPAVLFADEPTGNLDSATAGRIYDLFDDLSRGGLTLIAVTHNPELAARADRAIEIRDGLIVGSGQSP